MNISRPVTCQKVHSARQLLLAALIFVRQQVIRTVGLISHIGSKAKLSPEVCRLYPDRYTLDRGMYLCPHLEHHQFVRIATNHPMSNSGWLQSLLSKWGLAAYLNTTSYVQAGDLSLFLASLDILRLPYQYWNTQGRQSSNLTF